MNEQVHGAAFVHFGTLLHALRVQHALPHRTHNERRDGPALVHGEQSTTLLRAELALQGYPLELEAYRELEAGLRLPEDPVRFLDAVSTCLRLSELEVGTLLWHYAYDLLCAELSEALADEILSTGAEVERQCQFYPMAPDHNGLHRPRLCAFCHRARLL